MALKRVTEQVVEEKEFTFDFEIKNTVHRVTTKGVNELHALIRFKNALGEINEDISNEIQSERTTVEKDEEEIVVAPKKKAPAKKVVELKEAPVNVSNGIVFNQPKVVNNPGFQPKFREEIN